MGISVCCFPLVWRRWHFGLPAALAMLLPLPLIAQEGQYEQMVREMDEHSLPLVNLVVDTTLVGSEWFAAGAIEIADAQRRTDPMSDRVRYHCLVRYRGSSALGYDKKSFAIKLTDELGDDLDAPLLGIRQENSWILDAMAIDRARMRNIVCFDVWNEMSRTPYATKYDGRNGIKGCHVEVFVNGCYHGLYCLTDKVDRKLLGLQKAEADSSGVTYRGLLYKGVSWESGYDLLSYNDDPDVADGTWNAFELQYPQDLSTPEAWRPLMELIDFCSSATRYTYFLAHYGEHFDDGNLVDFVAFTWALNVGDNGYKNTFLSTPDITRGQQFILTPWDMDMSLGGNYDGSYNDVTVDADFWDSRAPFNRLLMLNLGGFADRVARRYEEGLHGVLAADHVAGILRSYGSRLMDSGAWGREVAKWDSNPVPLQSSVFEEVEYMADWYGRNQVALGRQIGVDGIREVTVMCPMLTGAFFTVDGRRIDTADRHLLPKGIYLQGGRKFVVK